MVCCADLYHGLQAGLVNSMTLLFALMGFAFFQLVSGYLEHPFAPSEDVSVQTISSSLGNMPVTAGYNGAIPALGDLIGPSEDGPLRFPERQLYSFGLLVHRCLASSLVAVLRKAIDLTKASALSNRDTFSSHMPSGHPECSIPGSRRDNECDDARETTWLLKGE